MEANYPVFVFPSSLKFYLNSKHTHKQLLTIYNPSDSPVRFKVLSTSPNKYSVIDPDGTISPQGCVDVVIRHTMPMISNCNVTDKFRIQMQDHATKQVLGKRDIEAKLLQGERDTSSTDGDNFHSITPGDTLSIDEHRHIGAFSTRGIQRTLPNTSMNYLIVPLGLVCIACLLLPTKVQPEEPSRIPSYLHLSEHIKLVFSYILGLVTMVIFRPYQ